ncbi:helix-turn-helix domain-containing protein [Hymenobacter negativus]|uniref:Helix-turn-helix transcriptional regulator n=1 Tax=Hymenobacter negativus TaxID=2795026 RepID=A0ABS3QJS4_9BACT|nr:AraC family transcriptional regulator [Hymenobacter negativus]MBO2011487.1 helix-turn-helix transcriptional regulator [Hymenobacter negativus]
MAFSDIEYREMKPPQALAELVESFWMLVNPSDEEQPMVLIPDGRVDTFFSHSATEPYHVLLRGLDIRPGPQVIAARMTTFAISWKLLAVEYLLPVRLAALLDGGCYLPPDYLGITEADLSNFETFCAKAAACIEQQLPAEIDVRKRRLFNSLYASEGALTVEALATAAGWSSRQINRYFTRMFGLSLKAYANILRFRASLPHLKAGRLFPEENFTDQAHFIREIKKYAGVVPKELARNQDDRFIQLSALPKE